MSVTIVTTTFAVPPQREHQAGAAMERGDLVAEKPETAPRSEEPGPVSRSAKPAERSSTKFTGLAMNLVHDQKDIWTSPAHLRVSDTEWLVPLSGLTAGLMQTDRQFSGHLSRDPSTQRHYRALANGGTAALVGIGGGLALWGTVTHNLHQRETGFLAGESAVDSLVLVEALKYASGRQRPFEGSGAGNFFHGGPSFPSAHAATAWSVAGVIAHEYPGPLPKLFAYGLASAVTASRVRSRDHFPSDVLIGSAIGWLVSQHVYSKHHDPELGGSEWNSLRRLVHGEGDFSPANHGSPYVPLDSWVYPALDRLAAMGLVDSAFAGMRPWTRRECARLLDEARDKVGDAPETQHLIDALQQEFAFELDAPGGPDRRQLRAESVYTRVTGISGPPLIDGFHFGQTVINDYGRPFAEGVNNITGFSGWASEGRMVVYVRGEYQHAPSSPALPEQARRLISSLDDSIPVPPAVGMPSVDRFRLLDSYVAMNVADWQVSFGKQTLWWGPDEGGPFEISNNIEPINMFRINRTTPLKLPSIFGWLGPMRTEFFLGEVDQRFVRSPEGLVGQYGQWLDPKPLIHGQKFSFQPTRNFQFGFHRTTIYGGPGYPVTWHTFVRSIVSRETPEPGDPDKPGNRTSGLDFSYRLPGLRNWVTFYGEGYTDDQPTPIAYADRSAWHAGLYFPKFPRLSKLDLRVEGMYTDVPVAGPLNQGGTLFYANATWVSGYTHQGNLIGSWVGREGQGAQAWSTYWLSSRNKITFSYRHHKISQGFIPGGGTINDGSVRVEFLVHRDTGLDGSVQYERWNFPLLSPKAQSNVTASLQLTYWPNRGNR